MPETSTSNGVFTSKGARNDSSESLSAWSWFERVTKVTSFLIIPIAMWAVSVQIFISKGARVTPQDLGVMELTLHKYVDDRIVDLLPISLNVDRLERLAQENNQRIQKVEISVAGIQVGVSAIRRILDSD